MSGKPEKIQVGIVGHEVVEIMRALVDRPTVPQPVHPILLAYGFACVGYGAKNKALGLGHPTMSGIHWLADVDSGGRYGAALHRAWYWEQRALFAESNKTETKGDDTCESTSTD